MANSTGVNLEITRQQPSGLRTTEEAERWKRNLILRPEVNAADHVRESPELARLASTGVTSVLAVPPGVIVKGRSALVNVTAPVDEPAIGNVGDYRVGIQVVQTPVALHVEFPGGVGGDAYPNSLLGVIAFVRQTFLDAQHQQAVARAGGEERRGPSAVRSIARGASAGARRAAAGRVRGEQLARDPACARHGRRLQAGSGHLRVPVKQTRSRPT